MGLDEAGMHDRSVGIDYPVGLEGGAKLVGRPKGDDFAARHRDRAVRDDATFVIHRET